MIPNDSGTESKLQLKIIEDMYDNEYICEATNALGEAEQVFTILRPIEPEPPSEVKAQ